MEGDRYQWYMPNTLLATWCFSVTELCWPARPHRPEISTRAKVVVEAVSENKTSHWMKGNLEKRTALLVPMYQNIPYCPGFIHMYTMHWYTVQLPIVLVQHWYSIPK